jgi:hypothetical protein
MRTGCEKAHADGGRDVGGVSYIDSAMRGAGKTKTDGPPRTFAKSQTHPPTSRLFFPLTFFFSTFLGVSRQGEFKNTTKMFLQKVLSKTFPKISTKNFDVRCQFFLDFFCFIAFSGASQ